MLVSMGRSKPGRAVNGLDVIENGLGTIVLEIFLAIVDEPADQVRDAGVGDGMSAVSHKERMFRGYLKPGREKPREADGMCDDLIVELPLSENEFLACFG